MLRLFFFLALVLLPVLAAAAEVDTKASFAYMIDYDTGAVLLDKKGTERMAPSSMTKLMTSYLLDQRLKEGRIKMTDLLPVSEKAWRMQGSKMFIHVGDKVAVEDLIRGIIIQSGNDACVTVAEGLSGTEEEFAKEMNKMAAELGMKDSHFMNSTGWPDDNHYVTARDLAALAARVIRDFPESYHYYSETSYTYNKITQANRNRLIGNDIGVDGLKTGHTETAGYGITLSAKNPADQRRLVLVINGLKSEKERLEEGDKLLRWGFREFTNRTIAKAGEKLEEAQVWFGTAATVPLGSEKDLTLTLPAGTLDKVSIALRYSGPIAAPIAKGAKVGDLVVSAEGKELQIVPLVATTDVPKVGGFRKMWRTLRYLVQG